MSEVMLNLALAGGALAAFSLTAVIVADHLRGRNRSHDDRLKALAAELESERAKLRGCREELVILQGQLDVYRRQEQLWQEEKRRLEERIEKLRKELDEKRRELNHLAKENRAALNLYESLAKGIIKVVDNEGNECRVLVDGSIICKDRLVYPQLGGDEQ